MDLLPRHFTYRALVGSFCLIFSSFAFSAVLDDPNYSWRLSSSGDVYRVYDPQGGRASSLFTPSSSFAEGSSGGVIETFAPPPLTIDGATGDVVTSLSRSLTVGDLIDGLGHFMAVDNPYGLAILGATTLLPFAEDIYNNYESSQPSTSPSSTYYCGSDVESAASLSGNPNELWVPDGTSSNLCYNGGAQSCTSSNGCFVSSSADFDCASDDNAINEAAPACSNGDTASVGPNGASSVPPSNFPQWVENNWSADNLSSDASTALSDNPSLSPDLASQLANNNTPLSSPVPYSYSPTSNTLSGSPSTTSSTNPSTGDTTTTTSTPSYKVSPGSDSGLSVQKSTTSVTQTCTSSGSCTTTNTSSSTSTPQPASPFVAPTTSTPPPQSSSIKSFALNLAMPSQSDAVCPDPLSFTALSNNFTIPLTPLCNLASDVNPYVES
ncbi:hypothetical protein RIE95_05950, partial [Acidithiobacillus thiooxidans]|uniref:hypothetical protein n=1 Tax=Acidithiobacillus thiooxidans TaxID=930 RepID=UPI002860B671